MTSTITSIVYLIESYFCDRDFERLGIELLRNNGFNVEIWDCCPFLRPKYYNECFYKTYWGDPEKIQRAHDEWGVSIFSDMDTTIKKVNSLTPNQFIFISLIEPRVSRYPIFKAISDRNIPYCILLSCLPPINEYIQSSASRKMINRMKRIKKTLLSPNFYQSFFRQKEENPFSKIHPARYNIVGGTTTHQVQLPVINEKTRKIYAHALDYDLYLQQKDRHINIEDIAVFLDVNYFLHNDFIDQPGKPPVTEKEYYSTLSGFFNCIEKHYGVKVVIAGHPHATYESEQDNFDGRPVFCGQTAQLVQKSRFVITTLSSSINFAVLFKKPMLLITTDQLEDTQEELRLHKLALQLGKNVINIDKDFQVDRINGELSVNIDAYEQFIELYVKCKGTPEIPLWQIFADEIKTSTQDM